MLNTPKNSITLHSTILDHMTVFEGKLKLFELTLGELFREKSALCSKTLL